MREKYEPETFTSEQVGAHVTKMTKEIIEYARETGKAGKPDDYTVEQHVEKVLYFIYNMNRQTPTKTEEEAEKEAHEEHIPLREDWERETQAEGEAEETLKEIYALITKFEKQIREEGEIKGYNDAWRDIDESPR